MVMEGVPANDELARLGTAVSATVANGVGWRTDKEIRKTLSVESSMSEAEVQNPRIAIVETSLIAKDKQ